MASYAVWSSRTFGVQSEGGVPNSSPSEPRPDLWEGRSFDPVGTFSTPKRHPSGWAPRWCPAKHSPCSPAKNVILSLREQDFKIKPLVCTQIIKLKIFGGEFSLWLVDLKRQITPWIPNLRRVARGAAVFPLHGAARAGSRARPPFK